MATNSKPGQSSEGSSGRAGGSARASSAGGTAGSSSGAGSSDSTASDSTASDSTASGGTASGGTASGSSTGTGRGRGRSGTKSRSSRSRTKAASSAGTTTRARVGRSSRRKKDVEPKPDTAVVDVSEDPVMEVADQESMTAPAADLQALDQEHLKKLADAQRSRIIKAVVLGVIGVLFVAFVLQNARPVNVKVVFGTVTVRMIWVIVASSGLGALAGFLVARPDQNIHFHLPERRGKKGTATTAD